MDRWSQATARKGREGIGGRGERGEKLQVSLAAAAAKRDMMDRMRRWHVPHDTYSTVLYQTDSAEPEMELEMEMEMQRPDAREETTRIESRIRMRSSATVNVPWTDQADTTGAGRAPGHQGTRQAPAGHGRAAAGCCGRSTPGSVCRGRGV